MPEFSMNDIFRVLLRTEYSDKKCACRPLRWGRSYNYIPTLPTWARIRSTEMVIITSLTWQIRNGLWISNYVPSLPQHLTLDNLLHWELLY